MKKVKIIKRESDPDRWVPSYYTEGKHAVIKANTETESDKYLLLMSRAFRRLAGVTQVINPDEGTLFHNRLAHSLKVGAIARLISEKIIKDNPRLENKVVKQLDSDAIESGGFIHDVGHPPFGHIGEKELNRLATQYRKYARSRKKDEYEGFNGNAQSFHVVLDADYIGGVLLKITLRASLKYPILRPHNNDGETYGVYRFDTDAFQFVCGKGDSYRPSLGAQIVDLADDICNAVYDYEDFQRVGKLQAAELKAEFESTKHITHEPDSSTSTNDDDFIDIETMCHYPIDENECVAEFIKKYKVNRRHIEAVNGACAMLTKEGVATATGLDVDFKIRKLLLGVIDIYFIPNIRLRIAKRNTIQIHKGMAVILLAMKKVIRKTIHLDIALLTLQDGHKKAIQSLYYYFLNVVCQGQKKKMNNVPRRFRDDRFWRGINPPKPDTTIWLGEEVNGPIEKNEVLPSPEAVRLTLDIISSLTDENALGMYRRISGDPSGSIMDDIDW